MIRLFDIADVNKSASAFNGEKLGVAESRAPDAGAVARLIAPLRWHLERQGIETDDEAKLERIALAQRERAKTLKEMTVNRVFL